MAVQTARRALPGNRRKLIIPFSGLRGWWKANAIASPPADGGLLQDWSDSSIAVAPMAQATSGLRPTYRTTGGFLPNGYPCVEFTEAGGTRMNAAISNSGEAITRFAVIRPKTLSGVNAGHCIMGGGTNGFYYGVRSEGNLSSALEGTTFLVDSSQPQGVVQAGSWYVAVMTDDGSTLNTIYLNGAQYAAATRATATSTGTTTTLASTDAGGSYFDGYIAEAIDYGRLLTGTERDQVTSYLGVKYGITVQTGTQDPDFLDFDFDSSENQAFTHVDSGWRNGTGTNQSTATHQRAWLTTPTRLGSGHSERFEIHNNTADRWPGNTTYRSMMTAADSNEGGTTTGVFVGHAEVYWAYSCYLPTSAVDPTNATVSAGFSQTQIPDYTHLWVIHERGNINGSTVGINNLNTVNNHSVMLRGGQLQYRQRCGTFTWNGSSWTAPAFPTNTPSNTSGSNDQVAIPIVKAGGTDANYPMNVWVDIIVHIRFRTDSTGLIEVWARQAGQSFTTLPNLTLNGPTHKVAIGSDSVTRTSADTEPSSGNTGCFMECGLYSGSSSWSDGANGAHVHIMDELRRYSTLAAAKANWG